MSCNPKEKILQLRLALKDEYKELATLDIDDPDVQVRVAANRRLYKVVSGTDVKAIQKLVYGMLGDSKDWTTNKFRDKFSNSKGKVSITYKNKGSSYKGTRKEEVKLVEYVSTDTNDYIKLLTYPSSRGNDVREYRFTVGSDTGVGYQIKKVDEGRIDLRAEVDVELKGVGSFSRLLEGRGSQQNVSEDALNKENKIDDYVNGDIKHMQNVVDSLEGSKEYKKHAKELLSKMSPKFFRDVELFIGKASGEQNIGKAGVGRIDIYLSSESSPVRNVQTGAEVYLHELLHTMTMFAFNSDEYKARKLQNELSELVLEVKGKLQVEDLYPKNATDKEKEVAEKLYSYIFDNKKGSEVGDQEFLVHALSNPILMDKLKSIGVGAENKKWMDRLIGFFAKMVRVVLGELSAESVSKNVYEHTFNLAYRLGEINTNTEARKNRVLDATDSVVNLVNDMDTYLAGRVQLAKDKLLGEDKVPDKYPVNGTKMEKNMYMLKFAKYALTRKEYRKALGRMFTAYGISPTSSVREFVGGFFERSEVEKAVDWLGLAAGKVDTMRESIVNSGRSMILEGFDKELTQEDDEMLTKLLIDTNIGVIYKEHGIAGVRKFADSDLEINKELSKLKSELKKLDAKRYNWMEAQAHGLGYYMATHIGNEAQNLNAHNIAIGLGIGGNVPNSSDIEPIISKIAALKALKYSKQGNGSALVRLIDKYKEGVVNVINMHEGFKTQTRETVFSGDPVHIVDGYSSEQFDPNIEIKVLPTKEGAKLKSLGFRKVKDLSRVAIDGSKLSVYVSEGYGVKERLRAAVKMTSMQAKGTSLRETVFANSNHPKLALKVSKQKLDKERNNINKDMASGSYDPTKYDTGTMALLNADGEVVDYRFTMSKSAKKELLKQDTRVSEVLPRSSGHVIDKVYTKEHNSRVAELIRKDMENGWMQGSVGKDGITEYTVISAKSDKEELRDIYRMLPPELKEIAESRDDKSIAVPSTLVHDLFGYQHLSLVHNKYAKHLPKLVVKMVGMVETLWMDLIKVVKGNILMKMPIVLIGNIVSNFILRTVNGANPFRLVKDYYESFVDVRKYTANNRDIIRLSTEIAASKEELKRSFDTRLDAEVRRKESEVARKKIANEKNPVKELVDAGLYQAIVEDVEVSSLEASTVWGKMGDTLLGKLPGKSGKYVKQGTDILYFNQRTKWFKINQEIMQLSDLVARDVQNRSAKVLEEKQVKGDVSLPAWWVKEKGWDKSRKLRTEEEKKEFLEGAEKVRMYSIMENYINYSRPSGRGEEYLNRMGVLMFTKYAKRIQKVVMDQGTQYPLKTFLALMVDNGIMNMSMIQDQHILAKEWHTETHGAGNFYPIYDMMGHIENFVTPALVKESTWDFLPI